MGIAVVDGQIASVVRDDADAVVATNSVVLSDVAPGAIAGTIVDLVSSAPFEATRIGLVAGDPETVEGLRAAFAPAPGRPDWFATVTVDALDSAMVQLARTDPALSADRADTGSVAVVNLDEYTAPTAGIPIITVDPRSGVITGRSSWQPGYDEPSAVLDPSGAANVADAISAIPGSEAITRVVFTGTGADVPGVHSAFETALGRPVVVAAQPKFAIAGAAAELAGTGGPRAWTGNVARSQPATPAYAYDDRPTQVVGLAATETSASTAGVAPTGAAAVDPRNRRRWWLIGGTAAAGFLILGGAIAAVLFSTGTAQRVVGVTTISVTTQTRTVTHTETETQNNETVRTRTVTPPTRTVTRTTTRPPSTVTQTTTVTEQAEPGTEDEEY